ncbi:MAG TPA: metalloregulator ArsR/SmtB family transcription factor [Actinomycetales bacterium]|nr:metalloregulator ArsR/SmtB family transcription factor [Actinomycetales bacterium]
MKAQPRTPARNLLELTGARPTSFDSTSLPATSLQATSLEARALQALADPTRRSIFELLGRGPRSVRALAEDVPVSRPAVSQHLKVLRESGLVTVRAEGTRNVYALDPRGLGAVRDYFDQFWSAALTAFAAAVDRSGQPQDPSVPPAASPYQEES